jgi:hypothetical protein
VYGVGARKTHIPENEDLNADILEGHLSSALCHMGNISYRLGTQMPVAEASNYLDQAQSNDKVRETFNRTLRHLADNNVDLEKLQLGFGKSLEFDPETEAFVNDEKADQMLTREYRKPFEVPSENML